MDRHRIRVALDEAIAVQPVPAFVYSGMLATLDNDEATMRECFCKALSYGEKIAYVNFDYAISLMKFGYYDEAVQTLMICLQNGLEDTKYLNDMACAALELNNYELSKKILLLADKLNIRTKDIRLLAMDMCLKTVDSPEAEVELLEKVFPEETLKENSVQISEEEWAEMQSFADELKQYL